MAKKSNFNEMISKWEEKFSTKFPYELVKGQIYKNNKIPYYFICHKQDKKGNEHGIFKISFNNLLNSHGCKKCRNELISKLFKSSFKEQISKWEEKFKVKFPYELVKGQTYENNNIKYDFICHEKDKYGNEHGKFKISFNSLYSGHKCNKCSGRYVTDTESFIKYSKLLHGDKYDYSKVDYTDSHTPVTVKCNKCGNYFDILPNYHLTGIGCKICGQKESIKKRTLSQEEFKEKIFKIFGKDRYDLTNAIYTRGKDYVTVKCNKCGRFFTILAERFLAGHGCQYCKEPKLEQTIRQILENNDIKFESQFKIKDDTHKYDFYLSKYNILIECQGEQHYRPCFFGHKFTDEEYKTKKEQQDKIDKYKYDNAIANNYKIVYFTKEAKYFRNGFKDINIYADFYSDKQVYIDESKLLYDIINKNIK